jgi:hypothetical protein
MPGPLDIASLFGSSPAAPTASPDLAAITAPPTPLVPALAGVAAAAPAPAPAPLPDGLGVYKGMALPSLSDKLQVSPQIGGADNVATLNDKTASPFNQWLANRGAGDAADMQYEPLTSMGGPTDRLKNFFSRQDPNAPSMDQLAKAATTYSDPRARAIITSDPKWLQAAQSDRVGFANVLQGMLDHADKTTPNVTPSGKPINDKFAVQHKADMAEVPLEAAAAAHEPHNYTRDEYVKAIGGLSWNQAMKLYQMQHYMPPAQLAMKQLSDHLAASAMKSGALYNQLRAEGSGASAKAIEAARVQAEKDQQNRIDYMVRTTAGQTMALPSANLYGNGSE